MTEIEAAKYIIQHKNCKEVNCDDCPIDACNVDSIGCHVEEDLLKRFMVWLAKHDMPQQPKPATRYDWSDPNLPKWVNFIATWENGAIGWFEKEPELQVGPNCWGAVSGDLRYLSPITCPDWRDSLEARPEGPKVKREIEATEAQWAEIEKIIGGEK